VAPCPDGQGAVGSAKFKAYVGYEVVEADLLLTDVGMPGMSGHTDNVMGRYGLDAAGDTPLHKPFNAQQRNGVDAIMVRGKQPGLEGAGSAGRRRSRVQK
jgi:hypothetical protein